MTAGPRLGVVIPTLDEARHLPRLLDDLDRLSIPRHTVVVDGGSTDGTVELARKRGAEVRSAPRGRASQLDAGARDLRTPWLLFLHADVRLHENARRVLEETLAEDAEDPFAAAVFRFRLEGRRPLWRMIERGQRLRERIFGLAYGDQGLLVPSDAYRAVGGYPDIPLMEDVEILRRLRRLGPIRRLPADLVSSPRRYERGGPVRVAIRNLALVLLYRIGVRPSILARWYPHGSVESPQRERILLVFARAPVQGAVKTRLARDVGEGEALRLYRRIGRTVVDQVRDGPYRVVVCFEPPEEEARVRRWLGEEGLTFRPQGAGNLGRRMASAFDRAFEDAGQVCIVGTDAPDIDRTTVTAAFDALASADVVLGPSSDGGYYLLALDRPRPELFRDVTWSTPTVLDRTVELAGKAGARVRLLDEKIDVDTAADLKALEARSGSFLHGRNI